MGGYSSEREISLKSGKAVFEALKQEGCEVILLDILTSEEKEISSLIARAEIDAAFIALHGRLGEDGTIQSILENLHIPYIGSGIQASRLAINKVLAQSLFKENGLAVAEHVVLSKEEGLATGKILNRLKSFPIVVKPSSEGSSIGIRIVERKEDLEAALKEALSFGDKVLVEEYIDGREFTVGILEDQPLCAIEIRPTRTFFDFTAKYQKGMTEYVIPAKILEKEALLLQTAALRAHQILGCRDFSRVDIMLGKDNIAYVLEVNTIPGFTSMSLLPKAVEVKGLKFNQLCLKLIELAYAKKEKNQNTLIHR